MLAQTVKKWEPHVDFSCSVNACFPETKATRRVFQALQRGLNQWVFQAGSRKKNFDPLAVNGIIGPAVYLAAKRVFELIRGDLIHPLKFQAAVASHQNIAQNAPYLVQELALHGQTQGLSGLSDTWWDPAGASGGVLVAPGLGDEASQAVAAAEASLKAMRDATAGAVAAYTPKLKSSTATPWAAGPDEAALAAQIRMRRHRWVAYTLVGAGSLLAVILGANWLLRESK